MQTLQVISYDICLSQPDNFRITTGFIIIINNLLIICCGVFFRWSINGDIRFHYSSCVGHGVLQVKNFQVWNAFSVIKYKIKRHQQSETTSTKSKLLLLLVLKCLLLIIYILVLLLQLLLLLYLYSCLYPFKVQVRCHGKHLSCQGCLSKTVGFVSCLWEGRGGVVALHLPTESLKTLSGLEPIQRCERSTYQTTGKWYSRCVTRTGTPLDLIHLLLLVIII